MLTVFSYSIYQKKFEVRSF